jgi:hypothetical protein
MIYILGESDDEMELDTDEYYRMQGFVSVGKIWAISG